MFTFDDLFHPFSSIVFLQAFFYSVSLFIQRAFLCFLLLTKRVRVVMEQLDFAVSCVRKDDVSSSEINSDPAVAALPPTFWFGEKFLLAGV